MPSVSKDIAEGFGRFVNRDGVFPASCGPARTPCSLNAALPAASTRSSGTWTCVAHASRLKHMAKMIQLRHVPDALHRQLKARAALSGLSLSDFLVREVRKIAEQPTAEARLERLKQRERYKGKVSPTEVLREEREAR